MKKTFTLLFLAVAFASTAQKVSLSLGTTVTNSLFAPTVSIEYGQVLHKILEVTAQLGTYKSFYEYQVTDQLGNYLSNKADVQDYINTGLGLKLAPTKDKLKPYLIGNVNLLLPNSKNFLEKKTIFAYTAGAGLEYTNSKFFCNTRFLYTKGISSNKEFYTFTLGGGVIF